MAEVVSTPVPIVIPSNYRGECMQADLLPDGGDAVRPTNEFQARRRSTHEHGLVITTSDFSSGARVEAERSNAVPVALMNGEQLVGLLVEHGIGVSRTAHDLLELGSLTVDEE